MFLVELQKFWLHSVRSSPRFYIDIYRFGIEKLACSFIVASVGAIFIVNGKVYRHRDKMHCVCLGFGHK